MTDAEAKDYAMEFSSMDPVAPLAEFIAHALRAIEDRARVQGLLKNFDEWYANATRTNDAYELGRVDSLVLVRAALRGETP